MSERRWYRLCYGLALASAVGIAALVAVSFPRSGLEGSTPEAIQDEFDAQSDRSSNVAHQLSNPLVARIAGGVLFFTLGLGISAPLIVGRYERNLKEGR